jgi:hypothetical protein
MKKELCAAITLILLIMVAFGNLVHLNTLTEQITAHIDYSLLYCSLDDYAAAHTETQKALELLENSERYTHVFVRHTDVDSLSETFYDILSAIQNREKYEAEYLLEKLRYRTNNILKMEMISLGSIF